MNAITRLMQTVAVPCSLLILAESLAAADPTLPDPDGKPADMSKPVKVFILLGQSNMLGFGKVAGEQEGTLEHAVKEKGLYPYLVDDSGQWTERKDVRNVRVMGSSTGGTRQFNNEWLTIKGRTIGPEIGIGHQLGEHNLAGSVLPIYTWLSTTSTCRQSLARRTTPTSPSQTCRYPLPGCNRFRS